MVKNTIISFKLISGQVFLGTYLSLLIPDVDGCGLVSFRSVVLKHRMKQDLLIKNKNNSIN